MFVQLVTARRLDREVMNETSVKVTCTDHGQQALTSDVTLSVHILDINDHAPRFDMTSYHADVVENSAVGTFVAKVIAIDDDDADNGLVHYILGNKRPSNTDPQMSETADYGRTGEKTSRQKDGRRRTGGVGQRRGRIQRNAMELEHAEMHGSQTEERRTSETGVRRRRATDGDCVGRVNIDKDSGVVTVVGRIDFEYSSVIHCQILAIDSGSPPKTGDDFHITAIFRSRIEITVLRHRIFIYCPKTSISILLLK